MSVPIESVRAAPIGVLAAGGAHKQAAIAGAIKLLEPTTLVTDAATARSLTADVVLERGKSKLSP
jgi:DNA-binding transcriptional regulator LsrR (DeoR family)